MVEAQDYKIVEYLMRAFDLALNDYNLKVALQIEELINSLDLPPLRCDRCGREMSVFEYFRKQGLCDTCMEKISKEVENSE